MDHTLSTVLLSSTVIISATFVFLFFVSCLPPGLALEDDVHGDVLSSLRFLPLLLVVDLHENGPRC